MSSQNAESQRADLQGADFQSTDSQSAQPQHADSQGADSQGADSQAAHAQPAQGLDFENLDFQGAIKTSPIPEFDPATGPDAEPGLTGLSTGQMSGIASFQDLVRQVFAQAVQRSWQKIILCDPNYEAWPLGEAQLTEDLNAWSKSGRELVMLAHHFDWVQARQARFVAWRRMWSHISQCCVLATTDRTATQTMIWTPEWAMQIQDGESFAGVASESPRFRSELLLQLEGLKQRGRPGFPVNVLGL